MNVYYVVFPPETEATSRKEVARRTRIDALPNRVYAVGETGLSVLRDLELEFGSAQAGEIVLPPLGDIGRNLP